MRYYTEEHEWVEINGETATVGISEYAVDELGEVSFIELPEEGDDFIVGDRIGKIEAENKSCDLYAPISGTVMQVNEELTDNPGLLNESAESRGWFCKLSDVDSSDLDDMMDEDAYFDYLAELDRR